MEIYRRVYPKFWSDDVKVLEQFTPDDRYLFLYIITNPHTNLCGCYELPISQVCKETGLNQEMVESGLNRLENTHQVIMRDGNEVFIRNWYKYNWTRSPKFLTKVGKVAKYIASRELREDVLKLIELYGAEAE